MVSKLYRYSLIGTLVVAIQACSDAAPTMGVVNSGRASDMFIFALPDGGEIIDPDETYADGGAATLSRVPVTLETRLQYEQTRAGEINQVSCDAFDEAGELIADARPSIAVDPDIRIERQGRTLNAKGVGDYRVWCALPAYGLQDETPAFWSVRPGEPVAVTTTLSATRIESGDEVSVTCVGEDAFGNRISIAFSEVAVDPSSDSLVESAPMTYRFFEAGEYRIACSANGVETIISAELTVLPGAASRMNLAVLPEQAVYRIGDIVEASVQLLDEAGNDIQADGLTISMQPATERLGERRFLLSEAGRHRLTAVYAGPTRSGSPIERQVELTVDAGGPAISCVEPVFGAQLQAGPGENRRMVARVNDAVGVRSVTIDGREVMFDGGEAVTNVSVNWGLNMYEVVAVDNLGERSSTLCGFFASPRYVPPEVFLDNSVMVRLEDSALDDGIGQRPFGSLGDIFRAVLNSQEFVGFLDESASASNPIVPVECRARLLGRCIFSAGVDFRSLRIGGPNDVTLQFLDGGIRIDLTLRDIEVGASLNGTVSTNGLVATDFLRATALFDVGLSDNGQARVTLRSIAGVEVGDISSDFEGVFVGSALEALVFLADTFFRQAIIDEVTDFVSEAFRDGLSDFFSEVQLGAFDGRVDVPSLAGGDGTFLSFSSRLSQIDFSPGNGQIGLGVRVSGPRGVARESIGSAVPMAQLNRPSQSDFVSGVADLSLVNAMLYQLWRSGYFEDEAADLAGSFIDNLPGVALSLSLPAPPAVEGIAGNGRIRLHLGPLTGEVVLPSIGAAPISFRAGSLMEVGVELLEGNEIRFDDAQLAELEVAVDGATFGEAERAGLSMLLADVIQGIINRTLTDVLPTIPLPTFATPESLVEFGVPAGIQLGIRNAAFTSDVRSWRAQGVLGELGEAMNAGPPGNVGLCENTCRWARDGACDDGGPGSEFSVCELGSDCADCGAR